MAVDGYGRGRHVPGFALGTTSNTTGIAGGRQGGGEHAIDRTPQGGRRDSGGSGSGGSGGESTQLSIRDWVLANTAQGDKARRKASRTSLALAHAHVACVRPRARASGPIYFASLGAWPLPSSACLLSFLLLYCSRLTWRS